MKTIYIAGQMTGLPDYGRKRFQDITDEILTLTSDYMPIHTANLRIGAKHEQYMELAMSWLSLADEVLMLDGWTLSKGALQEYDAAKRQGAKIWSESDFRAEVLGQGLEPEQTKSAPKKERTGKVEPTLVEPEFIRAIAEVRMYGNSKYPDKDNWRGNPPEYYRDAMYRHWLAYLDGEILDKESGLPHLDHAACNLMFIRWLDRKGG